MFIFKLHNLELFKNNLWIKMNRSVDVITSPVVQLDKSNVGSDHLHQSLRELVKWSLCKEWVKSFEIYVKFPPAIYVQQKSCNIFTTADSLIIKGDDQNWTYQHGIMKNDTSCPIENISSYLSLLLNLFLKIANAALSNVLYLLQSINVLYHIQALNIVLSQTCWKRYAQCTRIIRS